MNADMRNIQMKGNEEKKRVKTIHCMSKLYVITKVQKEKKTFNKEMRPRDGMTLKHFYIHGIYEQMRLCPCSELLLLIYKKAKEACFVSYSMHLNPQFVFTGSGNHFTCVFLSSQEQESALTKLNSFHN